MAIDRSTYVTDFFKKLLSILESPETLHKAKKNYQPRSMYQICALTEDVVLTPGCVYVQVEDDNIVCKLIDTNQTLRQHSISRAELNLEADITLDKIQQSSLLDVLAANGAILSHDKARYLGKQSFGLQSWEDDEAENLTAAIAEASCQVSEAYIDQDASEIHGLTESIKNTALKEIIQEIKEDDKLTQFQSLVRDKYLNPPQAKPVTPTANPPVSTNSNTLFYFAAGAVAVAAAAVVGMALTKPSIQ